MEARFLLMRNGGQKGLRALESHGALRGITVTLATAALSHTSLKLHLAGIEG